MKTIHFFLLFTGILCITSRISGQQINWGSLHPQDKHIINASLGAEYGVVYGLAYGYQIKNNVFPMIAGLEVSVPSGEHLLDDFKTKIGGRIRLVEVGHIGLSTSLYGVFRRTENEFVRLLNFGSDFSGAIGYYRSKWFVSGEFGFDKAIVTEYKHKEAYLDQFPGVVDGWYEPTTGGNFYYGLEAGYSFSSWDLFVKAGQLVTQTWKTSPLLPYYGKVGVTVHL